jgi:hypothetical protein
MRRLACLLLFAATLCAVPARAASVAVVKSDEPFDGASDLVYLAAPGEHNAPVFRAPAGASTTWSVTDAGAALAPGSGCTAVTGHEVACSAGPASPVPGFGPAILRAVAQLGDRDDQASLVPPLGGELFLMADGGAGHDVLTLPVGGGVLHGGDGDDELRSDAASWADPAILDGGEGRDDLRGGEARETLIDGDSDSAPLPDVIDGGSGRDTVSYSRRTAPVTVDLAAGRGGAAGEDDRLTSIEDAVGGQGADRIVGDTFTNALDGAGGRNTLIGGAGDDTFGHARGPVTCGEGDDVLVGPSRRDVLAPDCERINYAPEQLGVASDERGFAAYPPTAHRSLHYRIHCFRDEDELTILPCRARLSLTQASGRRRPIGRGSLRRAPWRNRRFDIRLTRRGRRLAARSRGVATAVRLAIGPSPPYVARWNIQLSTRR